MKILYILSGLGVLSLLAEIFRYKKILLPVVLVGLLGGVAAALKDWNTDIHYYGDMLRFNNYALLFTCVLLGIAILWFALSGNFFREESSRTDHFALVLFALCGAILLVSYSHLVMLFLGIEILSIPLYVLAGSRKDDLSSNESALKYFLMGAFATGFLLFGIALLYGCFGTFHLHRIQEILASSPQAGPGDARWILLTGGVLFMLIGLSFKVSAVPFHFWAPDVYQGAPTQVTAFMATIVKTAAFAAFLRLFMTCFAAVPSVWTHIVWILSALTILLGNVTAVYQNNVKRMLAYSSVSHAGYMLLAVLAMNERSAGAILYYAAAYSVSTIGAFTVLSILEENKKRDIDFAAFAGLAKESPLLALAICVSMLSLSGIPPFAGFFGKYYIFTAALGSGYVWLVGIAVVGSLIGVYYYFRVIISTYLKEKTTEEKTEPIQISLFQKIFLALTILLALFLGIFPDLLIRLI